MCCVCFACLGRLWPANRKAAKALGMTIPQSLLVRVTHETRHFPEGRFDIGFTLFQHIKKRGFLQPHA